MLMGLVELFAALFFSVNIHVLWMQMMKIDTVYEEYFVLNLV